MSTFCGPIAPHTPLTCEAHCVIDIVLPLSNDGVEMINTLPLTESHSKPSQAEIGKAIMHSITTGELKPGDKLPSIRRLAAKIDIAPGVVRRAFEQLLAQGWLEMRHGSGTYVSRSSKLLIQQKTFSQGEHRLQPDNGLNTTGSGAGAVTPLEIAGRDSEEEFSPDSHFRLTFWQERLKRVCVDTRNDLRSHSPAISFAPTDLVLSKFGGTRWRVAMAQWLDDCATLPGALTEPAGLMELRRQIASWLTASRGIVCSARDVMIVNGPQEARFLAARMFVSEGTRVAFEEPGSIRQRNLLSSFGATLIPISLDESGPSVEELNRTQNTRVIWTNPAVQFPTGALFTKARKQKILEWANANNSVIIEDESCSEFSYQSRMTPAIAAMDELKRTLYIGSLSQILPAEWRISFIVAPPTMQAPLLRLKALASRCTSPTLQWLLVKLFENSVPQQRARQLQRICESRRLAMLRALQEWDLPEVVFSPVKAGLFQTVWLPSRVDDTEIRLRCRLAGVEVTPVSPCHLTRPARSGLVLNFGALEETQIEEGIRLVGEILRQVLDQPQ
jgi:GntR family transcriptional regulator / MocR family aminotransferase